MNDILYKNKRYVNNIKNKNGVKSLKSNTKLLLI